MSGHTPNGFPFALGSDALTDWPPVSEELAGLLDHATLLGSPTMKVAANAAQVVPSDAPGGLGTLNTVEFGQGGLTPYSGAGILLGRSALYFALAQVTWDTYPNGFRQLAIQNWGATKLGATAVVPNAGGYTVQQAAGVMALSAGDVILPVLSQNSGVGITVHAAGTWLFVVQIAVLLPGAEVRPTRPGALPPDPQVIGEFP